MADKEQESDQLSVALDQAMRLVQRGDWEAVSSLLALLAEKNTLPPSAMELHAGSLLRQGQYDQACGVMEGAFTAHLEKGDARAAAKVASHMVAFHEVAGAEVACVAWEQRGLRLLLGLEPCVERGYLAIARTGCEIHDPVDLDGRAELALQLARQFGDRDLELRAQAEKGLALVSLGFVNAGFALLDEVMVSVAAGELRDDDMKARSICSMLSACDRTGDVGRAEYWCNRIEREPRLQHPLMGPHCRVTFGVVEALRGDWQKAETRLSEVMTASLALPYHRAVSAGRLGDVLIQQGKYEAAAEVLKGFEDRLEAIPALARLRMFQGHYDQAAALLRSVIRGFGRDSIRVTPVLAQLVEVSLALKNLPDAEQVLATLKAIDERCESNEIRAYTRLSGGRIARYAGELELAAEDFEIALTLLYHYERPLLAAQIRLELARVQVSRAPGTAIVEAEAALTTFRRLGVVVDAQAAEALLKTLSDATQRDDERTAQSTPKPTASLSQREREIALLTAQGMTNREIADQLVISVRTVEGHIDRVLGKLAFHTRTQLANWVLSDSDKLR